MKNNFCENCNQLTEEVVCPKCGAPTRNPQDGDVCFVGELDAIDSEMYADALTNNEPDFVRIPSFSLNALDSPKFCGVNCYNTPSSYKFYVKFASLAQAKEVFEALFAQTEQPLRDEDWIDRIVKVIIDRPKGSVHPEHPDIVYQLNYGHVEDVVGGDGEMQDAYLLDWDMDGYNYVGKDVDGYVIAVIRRKNDVETKFVVVTDTRKTYTREQIAQAVDFQEKYFDVEIIM